MNILPKFIGPVVPQIEEKGSSNFIYEGKSFCIDKS
jgi:hypothetical protein